MKILDKVNQIWKYLQTVRARLEYLMKYHTLKLLPEELCIEIED